jgi:hypothetical protein
MTGRRPEVQQIGASLADVVDPLLRRLFVYWDGKRGGRRMPARSDVDPLDLRFILGQLILVDVMPGPPPRFRIRLHGTELAQRAGYELTGKMLDELPSTEFRTLAQRSFATTAETRLPFHSIRDRLLDGKPRRYESLMLPLSADGDGVDMLLVGLRYSDMLP